MTLPRVLLCSMWRNDSTRNLAERALHLLSKAESYPALSWRWVVGDSTDDTAETLRQLSTGYDTYSAGNVRIIEIETGIEGDDTGSRLRRLSLTANHYLRRVEGYDYVLVCESDIISPANVVNRLVAHAEAGRCPIAAWPTLELQPGRKVFYDRFAYRKDGVMFSNHPPYHPCYKADRPFVVDSAGTVLMFHAEDASECIMSRRAILDLCWHLRELGRDIWVDPQLEVIQPRELWQFHHIEKEYA